MRYPSYDNTHKVKRNAEMVRLYVDEHKTLQNIGDHFGVTRERVRQIVRRAGVGRDVTSANFAFRSEADLVDMVCEECGSVTRRQPSSVRQFCSWRCSGKSKTITSAHALRELRRLALMLGNTPGMMDLVAPWPTHTIYYRLFGSLRAAQDIAGLTPNKRGGYGKHRTTNYLPDGFREQWSHLLEA